LPDQDALNKQHCFQVCTVFDEQSKPNFEQWLSNPGKPMRPISVANEEILTPSNAATWDKPLQHNLSDRGCFIPGCTGGLSACRPLQAVDGQNPLAATHTKVHSRSSYFKRKSHPYGWLPSPTAEQLQS
jgi:hypothetical protein